MTDKLIGIIGNKSELEGIISNEGELEGIVSNEGELEGIISNEGELEGVLENASLEVNVTITETGPRGSQGEQGPKGKTGDPGVSLQYEWMGSRLGIKTETESDFEYVDLVAASGDITYVHPQISASREWQIRHNLGKNPSVTVVDSANSVVVGDIEYLGTEELIIRFTSEFAGRAFLN